MSKPSDVMSLVGSWLKDFLLNGFDGIDNSGLFEQIDREKDPYYDDRRNLLRASTSIDFGTDSLLRTAGSETEPPQELLRASDQTISSN